VRQRVVEAWKEGLQTCCSSPRDGDVPSDSLVARWKQESLAQLQDTYAKHIVFSEAEVHAWIDETIREWKTLRASNISAAPAPAAKSNSSFSLFAGGGLSAFFSWPAIVDQPADDIWKALSKLEYVEDVWPDWTAEIRPFLVLGLQTGRPEALPLHKQWYGKARRQASPETAQLSLDFLENLVDHLSQQQLSLDGDKMVTDASIDPTAVLTLSVAMWTDVLIRQARCPPERLLTCLWKVSLTVPLVDTLIDKDPDGRWFRIYLQTHPSLYRNAGGSLAVGQLATFLKKTAWIQAGEEDRSNRRQRHGYGLSLLCHLLVHVRVHEFPWKQWAEEEKKKDAITQIYLYLWAALRADPALPQRAIFVEGLESLLADTTDHRELHDQFQHDWQTTSLDVGSRDLAPLKAFANA
jgi:hypothetical protein